MSREEEEADIQSDMSDYDESQDNHQADLLALLNAQCAASLGASIAVPTPTASTSSRNILQDKEESDNEEQEEDDEWNGIDDEVSHTHVQVPISSSSSLGKTPQIVSFSDSNTLFGGKRRQREEEQDLDGTIGDQKDDFMVSGFASDCKYCRRIVHPYLHNGMFIIARNWWRQIFTTFSPCSQTIWSDGHTILFSHREQ